MENEFGSIVQRYRERAGLTQDELATRLDVTQQTVGKWESGKAYPRPGVFAKLNNVLQIPAAEIMDLYGQSKGARSPIGTHSDLTIKQMEWFRKRHMEMEEDAAAGILGTRTEPTFPVIPNSGRGEPSDFRKEIVDELKKLMDESRKNGRWATSIRGSSLGWNVDYMDEEIVAEFSYASSPKNLMEMLRDPIRRKLWEMATLRAHLKDNRHYLLIIIMPGHVGMDYEKDDPIWQDIHNFLPNEIILRRLTAGAALLDISIFVANTPRQVMALLNAHGSDEDGNWPVG